MSPLIIYIYLIIVVYSRFLSYLANASFSLLNRIIFNFYLILIAAPDSSIL